MKSIRETAEEIVAEWSDAHQVDNVGPGTKARLVGSIEQALRDERERCAKIAETHAETHGNMHFGRCEAAVAAAIRKEDWSHEHET